MLLVCNIFYFRIFRFEAIILTIYHCNLTLFTFNLHTVKISTKKASMATVFLVMMSRITIIVDFALIHLNTSDLCLCIHSYGFFCPYLTFCLICYWSPIPWHLPWLPRNFFLSSTALLFGELFCHAQTANTQTSDDSLCHFTLAWVFHNLQKWNLIVDSGSSPDDALSIYGLRRHCQHWELLKFRAELPVWIMYLQWVLERCLLSFHTCVLLIRIF